MTDKLPIERLEELLVLISPVKTDSGDIRIKPTSCQFDDIDSAIRELIALRKAEPLLWRSALREIQNNSEVFGPYAGEMVRCVIDSVANSLEELVGDGELVIIKP